jgi:hypothetical protein
MTHELLDNLIVIVFIVHLTNFRAIEILQKEEQLAETKLREYELDPSVGLLVRPRSNQDYRPSNT